MGKLRQRFRRRIASVLGDAFRQGLQQRLSRPSSLPGTQTLADVANGPQVDVQGDVQTWYACRGDCHEPLLPRRDRCPVDACDTGASCWRCEYEESRHVCVLGREGGS